MYPKRRKRFLHHLALFILLLPLTCSSLDNFSIHASSTSTINGATLVSDLDEELGFSGFSNFNTTTNAQLENQGVEPHQIDSVHLDLVRLTITDPPSGRDFTFLDRVAFFVESPGLPRVLVAEGDNFAPGATMVELRLSNVDLADYITAESMSLIGEASGERPSEDVEMTADIVLDVDVDVSGALCGDGASNDNG